jgi:hypothetical protein
MFPDAVQGVYAERKGLAGRDVSAKIQRKEVVPNISVQTINRTGLQSSEPGKKRAIQGRSSLLPHTIYTRNTSQKSAARKFHFAERQEEPIERCTAREADRLSADSTTPWNNLGTPPRGAGGGAGNGRGRISPASVVVDTSRDATGP